MVKKKVFNIFLISCVLLILGVYYVSGGLSSATLNIFGSSYDASNSSTVIIKNNTNVILNFTISIEDNPGQLIKTVNITLPSNFTISDFGSADANGVFLGVFNGTSDSKNWTFLNETCTYGSDCIFSWTHKGGAGIGWNYSEQTSIYFWVNATAVGYDEYTSGQNISISVNGTTFAAPNLTNVYTSIDSLAPRISEINVSDGNTTIINGTSLNATSIHLGTDSPLVVRATVTDTNIQNMWLYYNASGNTTFLRNVPSNTNTLPMTTTDTGTNKIYNATIPASVLKAGNLSFILYANDSVDNWVIINATTEHEFKINLTENILKIGKLNATDASTPTYTRSDSDLRAGNKFLGANRILTFGVEISGELKNNISLYYNETRAANTADDFISMNRLGYTNGTETIVYNASIQPGIYNDTKKLRFLVLANDSLGYQTITRFNLTIDGAAPTSVAVTTSASSVTTGGAVTATCSGTDADSVLTYNFWFKGPNDDYSLVSSGSSTNTYTTSSGSTGTVGTYYFKCTITDSTVHESSEAVKSFTVTSANTGASGSGGGGGGSSVTPTVTETTEIAQGETENLGTLTQTIANNIIVGLNSIAKFSMATSSSPTTTSSHSLTINEITTASVTLTIKSDPIEITLNIGNTKTVDVDGDGTNDLEVTLNSITDGKADLTVNTLVAAPEVPTEPTEPVVTPEAKGMSWVWWLVIIIVIILVIVFVLPKKKK